jgi:hypothetical protein
MKNVKETEKQKLVKFSTNIKKPHKKVSKFSTILWKKSMRFKWKQRLFFLRILHIVYNKKMQYKFGFEF